MNREILFRGKRTQCISDWNHDLEETRYMNIKQKGRIHNNE